MKFKCECGKEFDNPQSFNGHKCHCKVHQAIKYGNLTKLDDANKLRNKLSNIKKSKKANLKKQEELVQWVASQPKCETCGRIMLEKFGSGRFCSRSCANVRVLSSEIKEKISLTERAKSKNPQKFCSVCGKKLKNCNSTGLCLNCLNTTEIGKQQKRDSGKLGYQTMLKNGTHNPWQSRHITSYAEKFWQEVLDNNKISYQRELAVKHLDSNYFLDFYIEVNGKKLDLEIDGKQHQYEDRLESDKVRDSYLQELGYIVYRVSWNKITSDAGKQQMQEKINKFLDYYNSL